MKYLVPLMFVVVLVLGIYNVIVKPAAELMQKQVQQLEILNTKP